MFSSFWFKIKTKTVSFRICYKWLFLTMYPFIFSIACVCLPWKKPSIQGPHCNYRSFMYNLQMIDIWNYCDRCFHIVSTHPIKSILPKAWIKLEDIVLREISQTRKKKILYDLTYMWNFLKSQTHGDRVEWWLPGAIGWVREI